MPDIPSPMARPVYVGFFAQPKIHTTRQDTEQSCTGIRRRRSFKVPRKGLSYTFIVAPLRCTSHMERFLSKPLSTQPAGCCDQ